MQRKVLREVADAIARLVFVISDKLGEAVEASGLRNQTYFTLQAFSHLAALQVFLLEGILLMFLITLTGNFLIIVAAATGPALHTPMYYFLKNLALIDICFTLNIVPKMLVDLLLERKVISFSACALQLYIVVFFIASECFLLGAMAYDRYMAICHPLHYAITMSRKVCIHMVTACWIAAPSYIQIIHTILQTPSAEGRRKAFFTCVAHLMVVTLFCCTTGLIRLKPKSKVSWQSRKLVALSYTVVTPMLNPIIYGLRNKVKHALRRTFGRRQLFSKVPLPR
ncbi:PREDICTED: LOW QUALITY PROTEIN: olfactory receptor 10A7-like [Aptenodytes forsteri]|uniref:LOW QUALITY PROTEIN: olfactory receptor 10A7-like n=1 Tax=Aptenodytes forsteri TaxID=9233 RepID=UPI000904E86B|nr:PREDICTED: LOW QUALITY PROTEIN: olfactory receptor 10A7-like [Aptenodytes forsteri]